MAEYEGDILRPPGVGAPRTTEAPDEVLGAYSPRPLKKGGTVKAGVGVLRTGEPVKYDTASKSYVKSVLTAGAYDQVDAINYAAVDATSEDKLINVLFGGTINAKLPAIVGNETALATALGGQYRAQFGYITFGS